MTTYAFTDLKTDACKTVTTDDYIQHYADQQGVHRDSVTARTTAFSDYVVLNEKVAVTTLF